MNKKRRFFLTSTLLVMGVFVVTNISLAAVGLQVGNSSLNLGAAENLYYGNISASSATTSNLLLLQNAGVSKLRVDYYGNLTTPATITAGSFVGPLSGIIAAGNVSAGAFGSNTGGGNYSFPGNVGIGNTAPAYKLDVSGDIRATGKIITSRLGHAGTYNSAEVQGIWSIGDAYQINTSLDTFGNLYGIGYAYNQNGGSPFSSDHQIVFTNNGSITSAIGLTTGRAYFSGNVGIGATNPSGKLDVSAGLGTQTAGDFVVDTTNNIVYVGKLDSASGNTKFIVRDRLGNEKLNIDPTGAGNIIMAPNGGNVGIGTISPLQKLHVAMLTGSVQIGNGFSAYTPTTVDLLVGKSNGNSRFLVGQNNSVFGGMVWNYNATIADAYLGIGANGNTNAINVLQSGNVGIGTTAPNDKLSIGLAGNVAPAGSDSTGHNYTNTYVSTDNYALANYGIVKSLIAAATSTMTVETNFWGGTKNANIWNGDAGAGNVGIGTTNPTNKLHLKSSSYQILAIERETAANANIAFINPSYTRYFGMNPSGGFGVGDVPDLSLAYFLINNTGNVGIGTTNPLFKTTIYSNSSTDSFPLVVGQASLANEFVGIGLSGFIASNGAVKAGMVLNRKSTYGVGDILFLNNSTLDNSNATTADAKMTIQSAGNVGIGTTAPGAKLDVKGSIWLSGSELIGQGKDYGTPGNSASGYLQLYNGGNGNSILWNTGNYSLVFGVNNAEVMRIKGGNVGIGTTAPNDKLSIGLGGSVAPAGSDSTGHNYANTYLSTDDYALTNYGLVKTLIAGGSGSSVGYWTMSGTNIYNSNSGNVGIGTTNPKQNLTVSGSSNSEGIGIGPNGGVVWPVLSRNGTDGGLLIKSYNDSNQIYTTNVAITSGGSVGMGTTAPSQKLDVWDTMSAPAGTPNGFSAVSWNSARPQLFLQSSTANIGAGGALGFGARDTTGTNYLTFRIRNVFNVASAGYGNNNALLFESSPNTPDAAMTQIMAITGAGNVGIGTTAPGAKLDVSGSLKIQSATGNKLIAYNVPILEGGIAGGTRVFRNLANFESNTSVEPGAIVINTGITSPVSAMSIVHLRGYEYSSTVGPGNVIDLDVASYFNGPSWSNRSYVNHGSVIPSNVRIGTNPAGQIVIVVGSTTDNWSYPKLWVESWFQSHVSTADASADNWSISMATDLTGYVLASVEHEGLSLQGGTMSGSLNMQNNLITNIGNANTYFTSSGGLNIAGNVGIGTTAPNDKLSIGLAGNVAPAGSDSTGHNYANTYLSTDNYALANYGLVKTLIAGGSGSSVGYWTMNGTSIYNSNSGNVGIGTTNPFLGQLHVNKGTAAGLGGDLWITNNAVNTTGNSARLSFGLDNTTDVSSNAFIQAIVTNSSGYLTDLIFGTYGTGGLAERMRINSSGNVGIGTTAPTSKLELKDIGPVITLNDNRNLAPWVGTELLGGLDIYTSDSSATGGRTGVGVIGGIRSYNVSNNNVPAADLRFYTSLYTEMATERMRIANNGNVGIGTTGPNVKLDVAGNMFVRGAGTYYNNAGAAELQIGYGLAAPSTAGSVTRLALQPYAHTGGPWNFISRDDASNAWLDIKYGSTAGFTLKNDGSVGIGTTAPNDKLSIGMGGVAALAGSDGTGHNNTQTYVGTDNYALVNVGYAKSMMGGSYLPLAGGTMTGDVNFGGRNITNLNGLTVSKITATTIDPLYNIRGINYSTFAPSISGGVKEEYVGKASIRRYNSEAREYEYVVDFDLETEGSDLWVWRQVVDYSDSSVQVIVTPSGKFAAVYYLVRGNQLVLRSDRQVEVSYRLIANRYDWREWPTKAKDQSQTGVIIK